VYVVWCFLYGVWCMVYGVWCMVYGVWCMVYGVFCMVYGVFCMVYGDVRCVRFRNDGFRLIWVLSCGGHGLLLRI